jgi:hypothetical protein
MQHIIPFLPNAYGVCFYAGKVFKILYAKNIFILFIVYSDLLNKCSVFICFKSVNGENCKTSMWKRFLVQEEV